MSHPNEPLIAYYFYATQSDLGELYNVPKVIDFPRINTKCSVENEILCRIFRVLSRFPLHFVLYLGYFNYFLDSFNSKIFIILTEYVVTGIKC